MIRNLNSIQQDINRVQKELDEYLAEKTSVLSIPEGDDERIFKVADILHDQQVNGYDESWSYSDWKNFKEGNKNNYAIRNRYYAQAKVVIESAVQQGISYYALIHVLLASCKDY